MSEYSLGYEVCTNCGHDRDDHEVQTCHAWDQYTNQACTCFSYNGGKRKRI
jgi:hypothetical protein